MTDEDKLSDEEVARFVRALDGGLLTYLWQVRYLGYAVADEKITALERELYPTSSESETDEKSGLSQRDADELQALLATADPPRSDSPVVTKAFRFRLEQMVLRMRPESNHGRAHFHIEYKQEYSATYAIDTLERLAGSMPTKYEKPMLAWAAKYQSHLLLTWQRLQAGENVVELACEEDRA